MHKKTWIILFLLALAVEITGVQLDNRPLQYVGKPLLMIILIAYFISQTKIWLDANKKWVILSLLFAWAGDLILLFQDKKEIFFMLGLVAFLIAHIFYIIFFNRLMIRESISGRGLLLLPIVTYYAVLMALLNPTLGSMRLPVRIYGIVISFMFLLVLHLMYGKYKIPARWMIGGAFLFLVSDSILAINKFYQSFETAGVIIILTYGLAQLFITEGAIQYIRSAKPI
ncbi:MAG TPA: lysoplasmalogenase [Chitinophagaceae bacterium]|nr:lysoplasmalogenase [Chitinophagaceae bacterium]